GGDDDFHGPGLDLRRQLLDIVDGVDGAAELGTVHEQVGGAHLRPQQVANGGLVGEQRIPEATEGGAALGHGHARPGAPVERLPGGGNSGLGLGGASHRGLTDDLLGGGIDDRFVVAAGGLHPLAIDVELVDVGVGYGHCYLSVGNGTGSEGAANLAAIHRVDLAGDPARLVGEQE